MLKNYANAESEDKENKIKGKYINSLLVYFLSFLKIFIYTHKSILEYVLKGNRVKR